MSGVSSTVLSSQFEADADAIGAPEQVIERLVGRRRRIGAACRPRRDHRRVLVQEVVHREVKFELLARHFDVEGQRGVEIERSEEHTSELQSLMRISYAVFCLKTTNTTTLITTLSSIPSNKN